MDRVQSPFCSRSSIILPTKARAVADDASTHSPPCRSKNCDPLLPTARRMFCSRSASRCLLSWIRRYTASYFSTSTRSRRLPGWWPCSGPSSRLTLWRWGNNIRRVQKNDISDWTRNDINGPFSPLHEYVRRARVDRRHLPSVWEWVGSKMNGRVCRVSSPTPMRRYSFKIVFDPLIARWSSHWRPCVEWWVDSHTI